MASINKDNEFNTDNYSKNTNMRKKVEVYSTVRCPYCELARQLLDKKGIAYTEYFIDKEAHLREEMVTRSNRTSVPQIFVGNVHVGGFEDMAAMDLQGELDLLLGLAKRVSGS